MVQRRTEAADKDKAPIVAIHHPPFSAETEHSDSSVSEQILFSCFAETTVYPRLMLAGHVHNYQRFTVKEQVDGKNADITCTSPAATRSSASYTPTLREPEGIACQAG